MASTVTSPTFEAPKQHGENAIGDVGSLVLVKVNSLIKKIEEDRIESIKAKLLRNRMNLQCQISKVMTIISARDSLQTGENTIQMLSSKIENPLCKFGGISQGLGENECINNRNIKFLTSIKIPYIERLPPFTSSIHLTRNQQMLAHQSIIGKKKIYYDKHDGETLIYVDNDKESTKSDDIKRAFSVVEDQILWMAFEEHGFTEEVLSIVSKFVNGTVLEIQERYKFLREKNMRSLDLHFKDFEEPESISGISLDKSLNDALATFDSLFCQQCIQIFDCPLHGCSQPIYPCEKQKVWSEPEGDRKPCCDNCYLRKPLEAQVDGKLSFSNWKPLEKDLYLKGVEIFGRNSLKTCIEVASYMYAGEVSVRDSSTINKSGQVDAEFEDREIASGSRVRRKTHKIMKFKYSSKFPGLPSTRKGITIGRCETYKQYTPCGCQEMCGKQCPCLHNGSCCEKYCGCSKLCKNRFRGCYCAKSQCRSRQCPCFAAERECDPDVCRNCWVSCGGGSLGEPPRHGDGQCGNMRLLLRQNQRILLAKSDVEGWGAFLKNPANKNDYLGELTGELISHLEAEKRGKMYDRAKSSFLFNLNDQYVLDTYRNGNKLKFAKHSEKPNCYSRIMLVGGDHRVGIFAKERIEAGEELFYDYSYGPEQAPTWF